MNKKLYAVISLLVMAAILLCGCSKKKIISIDPVETKAETKTEVKTTSASKPTSKQTSVQTENSDVSSPYDMYFEIGSNVVDISSDIIDSDDPVAIMKLENRGYVVMVLFPSNAPNTVNNFISLVANGKYDAVSFFGFDSKLGLVANTGEDEYALAFEKVDSPMIRYSDYVVFMNKDPQTGNTSGTSFFISLNEDYQSDFDNALYKDYVAIGKILEGEEVLERIAVKAGGATMQFTDIPTIEQIIVDLNGYTIKDTVKIAK